MLNSVAATNTMYRSGVKVFAKDLMSFLLQSSLHPLPPPVIDASAVSGVARQGGGGWFEAVFDSGFVVEDQEVTNWDCGGRERRLYA